MPLEQEKSLPVEYKGIKLDCSYRLDFVVAGKVIVELKAVDTIHTVHEAQLLTYLKLTGCQVGLLINFNVSILKSGRKSIATRQATATYRIDVKLDPAAKTLAGNQTMAYYNASPDALSELPFHLYLNAFAGPNTTFMRESGGMLRSGRADPNAPGWIKVDSVRLNNTPISQEGRGAGLPRPKAGGGEGVTYNDDHTVMTVTLPAPLQPGKTIVLDMDFHAQLPKVFARTGWREGDFFMVVQWFPKIAVYDDLGWHSWPFHANAEFFADFGTYDVNITVPQSFVVGATGFPEGRQDNGDGTRTDTYHAEDVIDFAWTASPHYQTATRKWNDADTLTLLI